MDPRTGIILKLVATLAFTIMSACVKGLGGSIPIGQVIFFRALFAFLPLCMWLSVSSQGLNLRSLRHAPRILPGALAGLGGMLFAFSALTYLPLVDVTVIGYTTPLFTIMLAALLLGERVRIYRWSAVVIGFAGVIVTLSPNMAAFYPVPGATVELAVLLGTALALAGALCAALSSIAIRKMSSLENPLTIVLVYSLTGVAVGLVTSVMGWVTPGWTELALLVGCGLAGGIGQITMTLSLRHAQASLLAPFDYATLIWVVLLGYVFLAKIPTWATITGAALVIAAGLFASWRESLAARRAKREAVSEAFPPDRAGST